MSYALVQYCLSRLPMQHIERLGDLKIPFELHAVPFQFLQKHHSAFGFDWVERLVWRTHELHKPYNFLRPELLLAQKSDSQRLVTTLTIIPRKDYIRHYTRNLGGRVVTQLAARRPRAICYVAKQGTLLSPDDIHCRIYSPTRYCVFDKGQACWCGDEHPALPINPLSSRFPTLDRGLHVSTPTFVEQDVEFRTQLETHGAASIDNELAQMARALTDVHEESPSMSRIQLLPIIFITDHLRRPEELRMSLPFDLTSRNQTVQYNKELFLARASYLVLEAFDVIQRPKAVIVGTGYGIKTILPAL
ncbi:hypothetical protein N7527_000133 [Penicillium freii]|nr:hypothetical protein N7527_000133 [Penicillium freii]